MWKMCYMLGIIALPLIFIAVSAKPPVCPPGAVWSYCAGCEGCPVVSELCLAVCREGCKCKKPGYFIHKGACIPKSACPTIPTVPKPPVCPPGAVWSYCAGCEGCPVVGELCLAVCRKGCKCKKRGYFIHNGACIPKSACPTIPTVTKPQVCPPGAVWSYCAGCEGCPVEGVVCLAVCREGCKCEQPGYFIHEGACIPESACPTKPTVTKPPVCPPGAVWSYCAGCEGCPVEGVDCLAVCREGCKCEQPGYFIHEGACIPGSACPTIPTVTPTCLPGMIFSNCVGCWSYCPVKDLMCIQVCREGCACAQKGYVIHKNRCIPSSECPVITE